MPLLTDREINYQADNILAFLKRTLPPAEAALVLSTLVAKFLTTAAKDGDVNAALQIFTATVMTTLTSQGTAH